MAGNLGAPSFGVFPDLIAELFLIGLRWAFYVSAGMCGITALASLMRGRH